MFLLYHSEGCNICEMVLHECYLKDLHTTTCSGMLGLHSRAICIYLVDDGETRRHGATGSLGWS
jgi:hypothetical protein